MFLIAKDDQIWYNTIDLLSLIFELREIYNTWVVPYIFFGNNITCEPVE